MTEFDLIDKLVRTLLEYRDDMAGLIDEVKTKDITIDNLHKIIDDMKEGDKND